MDGYSLTPQVIYLGRENLDGAVEVLTHSLADDPLPRYLFETSNVDYQRSLGEVFRFSCEVRLDLDWPLLGCIFNSTLVGVAGLSEPEEKAWPESLNKTYREMGSVVGPQAIERLESYSKIADSFRPDDPHFYLGVLGVNPTFQGRGFGGLLMKEIGAISAKHPSSIGVGLDTENEVNVSFYEGFGYKVIAHTKVGGMDLWSMFRPNPEGGEG